MSYPGGKAGSGVYQQIINQIPPHNKYIEPFLGSGAVMRHKLPALSSIGIDADASVIDSWDNTARSVTVLHGDAFERSVTVLHGDAISFLEALKPDSNTFIYCDPPYLFETRSSKKPIYNCEFGKRDQHKKLLNVLLSLDCMVATSGYMSPLYSSMLAAWRTINYQTRTRGGSTVTEYLWMNYAEPLELHDYRYLGDNFRERERIKRIKQRWIARLERMNTIERFAILASIAEYKETGP